MAVAVKTGVFVISAKRTPFGRYGGILRDVHPSDLLVIPAVDALRSANVDPKLVDTVNVGQVNAISGSSDGGLTPRHAALKSGVPRETPVLGINRLCGSGFQAIINSTQDILTGAAKISLAGGVENMSAVPFVVRNIRFGVSLGSSIEFEDCLAKGSLDTFCNLTMPQTAENLAEKYNLDREEVDKFALESQRRWKAAQDADLFQAELSPIRVKVKKSEVVVERDEHPRPDTTSAGLATLPALFRKHGVVTAGNSSGVNDGSGSIILADEDSVRHHGLSPLARVAGWSCVGVDPSIMGIGPVPAIRALLAATGNTLDDIDLVEINEAFSAQTLACIKELNIDKSKVNVNGGAIAVGHPLGASGVRITAHLVHELRRRGAKKGIGSACIGGGQGIAVLVQTL